MAQIGPEAAGGAPVKSLLCIQDELSNALSLLEQARLAERTDAFADRTRRWFGVIASYFDLKKSGRGGP